MKIAIIVPFRNRHEQLRQFISTMTEFFKKSLFTFKIFIIEQSNDGKKFNRGKLLNVGYLMARKEGFTTFIFHDVDLLPDSILWKCYFLFPSRGPCHLAHRWNRYSSNENYFGGIVSFSAYHFELINGFPNNFWGWGGEDDELLKRVKKYKLPIYTPSIGSITDLENLTVHEKLNVLRQNNLKCMNKWELLSEENKTGLSSMSYQILNSEKLYNDDNNVVKFIISI